MMLMRRRRFIAVLVALTSASACRKAPRQPPVARGELVLAFGDSVTFGTGAAPGEDWPTRLATLSGWRIVNAGVPGDTAENGPVRLAPLLAEHRPALVIVELGGNDFLRRRPAAAVKDDLRRIIHLVRHAGSRVVLIGVPELSLLAVVAGKPGDAPLYRELAEEENVPLIPDVFSEVLSRPELCADRIHPNAAGYRQMADGLFAELQRLGFL